MFRLLKSLVKSAGRGMYRDPELQKFFARHPRLFHFVKSRLTPDEAFGLHLTVGAWLTFVFLYCFFGVLQDYVGHDPLIEADLRIINLVQTLRTPLLSKAMLLVTYLGKWQIVFAGILFALVALIIRRFRYDAIILLVSVLGGETFVWLVKNVIDRPRPPLMNALAPETSYSFPSGHAFVAVSFYGLLAYVVFRESRRRWIRVLSVLGGLTIIFWISFSRVYLGVHWPSDVLASLASGAAWLTALITASEIRRRFFVRAQPPANPLSPLRWRALLTGLTVLWLGGLGAYYVRHPLNDPQAISAQILPVSDIDSVIERLPRTSEDITGKPMEPVNLIVVGSWEQLNAAFVNTGWTMTDPITVKTVYKLARAATFNTPYPAAPGTPSFWLERPNEIAFEMTVGNSARERHHIHFWNTHLSLDGQPIWYATAHYDESIKVSSSLLFPVHSIDPAIDKEREHVRETMLASGLVDKQQTVQIVEPHLGQNQAGDQFFTDGKAHILYLKR